MMKRLLVSFFMLFSCTVYGQAFNTALGYSGLVLTPTADILGDGVLTCNIGRLPKLYAENYRPFERTAVIGAMGFLPFMEVSFGFVRPDGFQGGIGDRTASARLRVLAETARRPAVAIGLHDFFAVEHFELEPVSAQHFSASYIVGTKHLALLLGETKVGVSLGYGTRWLAANDRQLDGFFGGIDFQPAEQVQVLLEYDANSINGGVRLVLSPHIYYSLCFWRLEYVMHQLSFRLNLL